MLTLKIVCRIDAGCGNLITFLQFLSISLYGLIFTVKFFKIQPNIPMQDYVKLVIMFFVASWLNNYALNFNISVPLLMIFRSGSLMANMVLGIFILNKSYDIWKYISVVMITVGIFACTIATGSDVKKNSQDNEDSFFYWMIGVFMLSLALFLSARMGLYQEMLYKKRGKHATEALFYTHFLAMPAFLVMSKSIYTHFLIATQSQIVSIPILDIPVRIQIVYLVINFLSHYMCICCVYTLTAETSSLTVTLVITLRKFVSLIYSIIYFQHPFTTYHWIGTLFIIIGTIIFTEIIVKIRGDMTIKKSPLLSDNSSNEDDESLNFSFPAKFFKYSKRKFDSLTMPQLHSLNYKKIINETT